VACGQSGRGGSPAAKRGGGGGAVRGGAVLCSRSGSPNGTERDSEWGKGVEAGAWARCFEAERVGATGVHAVNGVSMRPPRDVKRLRAVGAARRAREKEAACGVGLGRGERVGPMRGAGVRADAGRGAGPASADGPEVRRRPVKREKHFSNSIFNEFSNIRFQIPF
jgi:hypothetical protein